MLETFLHTFHATFSEYNISVDCEYLAHGDLVLLELTLLREKSLKCRLSLTLEVSVAPEADTHHCLVFIQHLDQLLNKLRLGQDLLNLCMFFVFIGTKVHACHQLLSLLQNVVFENLCDWLVILFVAVSIERVEQTDILSVIIVLQEIEDPSVLIQ